MEVGGGRGALRASANESTRELSVVGLELVADLAVSSFLAIAMRQGTYKRTLSASTIRGWAQHGDMRYLKDKLKIPW